MRKVNCGPGKLGKIDKQLADVKTVMEDNINKVLERGDKLEDLVEDTNELAEDANVMRSQAITLQRNMW